MPEQAEYQPWMDSPWVETMENYEEEIETVMDLSKISWFDVKMDLGDTEEEKKEKVEAMQEQIRMGILQKNGLPTGMQIPQGMHVVGAQTGFNFPGAIGIPLPAKFIPTPVTRHLQGMQGVPGMVPANAKSISPTLANTVKGQDRSIFERGNEKLRRIQELTQDRRK